MIFLLYIGILFISFGIFLIIDDIYDVKILLKEREFKKREDFKADNFYQFKALLGAFAIVLGIFNLLNYFIY